MATAAMVNSGIEYRSIDGTGNNLANPEWGSTLEQLLRRAAAEYADGVSAPAGADRLSARELSNLLVTHSEEATPNDRDLTAYLYIWGQFLDHDLDLTPTNRTEPFPIDVPAGDPFFDPDSSGDAALSFSRSVFDAATGTSAANPRQQINAITAWIDGSMVYGSDAATAASLRAFAGGRLLESARGLPHTDAEGNFVAGDIRANENIELTSMHALFVREHNRLAGQIAAANPGQSDEEIYQRARAIVIGEIQVITYNEWLPALLGSGAIHSYRGYSANVNPGIATEFSTAAFRLHSSINDDVEFFDNEGRPITFTYVNEAGETVTVEGEIALSEAFFNPTPLAQSGVDGILKYAASTHAEEIDTQLVDSLRNFVLAFDGSPLLDLAALNIQRGRDHGLADYNSVRAAYGLPRVTSFSQITSNTELAQALEEAYGSVDNIDLWVGGLAEDHVRGASVGPLVRRIIAEQFERLRDGDRFWYQRTFTGTQLAQLERTTLADIIERNTDVAGLQDNVFFFRASAAGRVFQDANGDGDQDRGESSLARVTVELLDDAGEVIATTTTGRDGRYRFNQFGETGDFQVRVVVPSRMAATTENPHDFLISTGDVNLRGLDFGLRRGSVTSPPTTPTTPTTPTESTSGFDIQFVFSGLTASQQVIFEQAAARWESIIVGELPNAKFNGQVVDDLLIGASAVVIDGTGNTLGQAAPDRFRGGSLLPYHGEMEFDTADLASLEASGELLSVILHEMGHVLGIGTLWSAMGLLFGAGTNNPRFTGTQAIAAYNAIFGTSATGVPVENTRGSGTRNAHWRESVLGSELMTGYLGTGTSNPLSRLTAASLADLGYSVNLAAADAFSPARSASLLLASGTSSRRAALVAAWPGQPPAKAGELSWETAVDSYFELEFAA